MIFLLSSQKPFNCSITGPIRKWQIGYCFGENGVVVMDKLEWSEFGEGREIAQGREEGICFPRRAIRPPMRVRQTG